MSATYNTSFKCDNVLSLPGDDDCLDLHGCGEWTKTCEEECVNTAGEWPAIPRVVHFIKVDSRFGFLDWVAVMAARKMIKPEKILYFSAGQLNSCWWNRTKPLVTHTVLPEHVWVANQNNEVLKEPAHKADFLRTALVYHLGGMYLNSDIIAVKSFDSLLDNQVVLSRQMGGSPANGLILARKHSCFACSFARRACQTYNGQWAAHSVHTLSRMVEHELKKFHDVTILEYKEGFFQFGWNHTDLHKLFEVDMDSIQFNLSDVNSLHFYNHVSAKYQQLFRNKTWLLESSSAAATAIRMVLPADFNVTDLDEKICTSSSNVKL